MSFMEPRITPVSEDSVLVRFGETISEAHISGIVSLVRLIDEHCADWVIDMVPSYTTLLIQYDLNQLDHQQVLNVLKKLAGEVPQAAQVISGRQIEIPVWYDPEVGYDLESLAQQHGLTTDEVIDCHSGDRYRVYALGFTPGFAFMGRVHHRIATPRHASPRDVVAAGSVGIADSQTAIYPRQSPGGWQIIGRSPQQMFDPAQDLKRASLLNVGDQVRFTAIDRAEFLYLGGQL